MTLLTLASLIVWLGILATGAWRLRERLEADPQAPVCCDDVTVLIPARNEAAVVARCVRAVAPQVAKVIVVDDESNDATAQRVQAIDGVELVTGEPRPAGWSGKLWALEQGLDRVHTQWVLLLDADISVRPRLIATMRRSAVERGIAMLSLMVELQMQTLVERWLMPPFVYFFRLLYPFGRANDATAHHAAAAGGCVLVRRTALHRAGAFASLRDAIIDDCTLARRIKQAGFNTWVGLTRSARSLRGYTGLAGVAEMVARTAYTQLRYSPLLLALCTAALALAFWVPLLGLALGPGSARAAGVAALLAMALSMAPLLRFYGLSVAWVLGLPAAATVYMAMTWLSAWRYWRGIRSRWKERVYRRTGAQRGGAN